MINKKLTLLIALSIIIATLVGYAACPVMAAIPKEEVIVEVAPEPVPPIAEETVIVEEVVVLPETEPEPVPQGLYPAAEEIWIVMKSYGWSDIICAGILGNMMRECGGDTLNLNPYATNSHYGLCQWSKTYHYGAWGKDIAGQLEYLKSTLNIGIFEGCSTPEQVATVFCWKYERPSRSDPVHKRQANARIAYEYFVEG